MFDRPILISGEVQHYPWGKKGTQSYLANFIDVTPDKHYAELWFGAHPSLPSKVGNFDCANLLELIKQYPKEVLGDSVNIKYQQNLPFLFKILSIEEPLSIQAHPTIELARKLNLKDSKNYPDANHKPELGVALTEVELLYGFRKWEEICEQIAITPEFDNFFSQAKIEQIGISQAFTLLMSADTEVTTKACAELLERLASLPTEKLSIEEKYILPLLKKNPDGDIGVFCFYFLNIVKLNPGEGIYIAPNICHAYLRGDLVECMASSDNVIRAGLTTKFIDKDTLLAMLDYNSCDPNIIQQDSLSPTTYQTPAEEFELKYWVASANNTFYQESIIGPKLILALDGEAIINGEVKIKKSECLLIPAKSKNLNILSAEGKFFIAGVPNVSR